MADPTHTLNEFQLKTLGLVDVGDNKGANMVMTKRKPTEPNTSGEGNQMADDPKVSNKMEGGAPPAKDPKDEEIAALKAELEALKASMPKPDEKLEALKAIPAEFRKRIEDAEKALAVEVEKREEGEYVAKAKTLDLGIEPTKLGKSLRKLAKALTADEYTEIEGVLKAAAGARKEADSILKEHGKLVVGDNPDSAEAKLQKRAGEIRAVEKHLTKEQAYSKACDDHPELFAAAMEE